MDSKCPLCKGESEGFNVITKTFDYSFETTKQEFIYVQCRRCDMTYLLNQPIFEDLNLIYPNNYSGWKSRGKIMGYLRRRNFQNLFKSTNKITAATNILDFGCGNGEFLNSLYQENLNLVGFDFTLNQIESPNLRIQYIDDIQKTSSMDEFDHIYLLQVLEHLADPVDTMKVLLRKLSTNGVFVIQTPTREGWDCKIFPTQFWGGWHAPRHFHIWNENYIEKLARILDLKILEVSYIPSPFLWAETLRARIKNKRIGKFISSDKLLFTAIIFVVDLFQIRLRRKTSNLHVVLGRNLTH